MLVKKMVTAASWTKRKIQRKERKIPRTMKRRRRRCVCLGWMGRRRCVGEAAAIALPIRIRITVLKTY